MSFLLRAVYGALALVVCAAVPTPGVAAGADLPARNLSVGAGGGKSACPHGATSNPKRTRAVLRRLRSQTQGKGLLAALRGPLVVCYGNVSEGILQTDAAVVLQEDHAVPANAARLGHLLSHIVQGTPLDENDLRSSTQTCDELVSTADRAERAAHELENDLRQAFRLPPLAFEDLSDTYRHRCEAFRKDPPSHPAM